MSESQDDRWLTYVELGQLLGCTPTAARMYARRHGWPRRTPNMYGDRARVLVPDDIDVQPRSPLYPERTGYVTIRDQTEPNGQDQENVQAFRAAITALSEALAAERERSIRAERQTEQLLSDLADARTAERISSDAAAALRNQLDLLRARRPWWQRWFW